MRVVREETGVALYAALCGVFIFPRAAARACVGAWWATQGRPWGAGEKRSRRIPRHAA